MTDAPLTQRLTTLLAEVDNANKMTAHQLETLGGQLGDLYRTAEAAGDQAAMQATLLAWEQAQALNANAIEVNVKAVAIATVATEAIIERDAALESYEQLDEALTEAETKGFSSHPRIKGVMDNLMDALTEEWESEGLHLQCPGCEVVESGNFPGLDHDAVNGLCHMLFGDWHLEAELEGELTAFINDFYERARAFEHERTAAARQRLAEEEALDEDDEL